MTGVRLHHNVFDQGTASALTITCYSRFGLLGMQGTKRGRNGLESLQKMQESRVDLVESLQERYINSKALDIAALAVKSGIGSRNTARSVRHSGV